MVDLAEKSANNKKKRKLTSAEKPKPPKKRRSDGPQNEKEMFEVAETSKSNEWDHTIEVGLPWRNLQLVLWLQNKEIDLQKKVELAFSYVNSKAKEGAIENEEDDETIKVSQHVVFINDWVQSLLISTDKKILIEKSVIEACLDHRCWLIFKYCLEESLKLQVSLSLSRNLLRSFCCVARNALSLITEMSLHSRDLVFIGEGFELYGVVLDCVSLVFLCHGGLSNENLDLWVSTVCSVLELVLKIYDENLVGGTAGAFALRFSCLVLEPFAKFLRVHPPRKNGFHDFVDELLGLLLHLLGVLHVHSDGCNAGWTEKLLTIVEEVLSQGLFHSIHMDGFLSLHSTGKYSASGDEEVKHSKTFIKSYHRHLFDKLGKFMASKKDSELNGLGELFHLFVNRVKNRKAASIFCEGTKFAEKTARARHLSGQSSKMLHHSTSVPPENSYSFSNLTKEKRESILDFFVQIMDPLFLEMSGYLQTKLEGGPLLLDVHCILKSINHLLASLFNEKIYIKTEDISEGAFLNFLKKVYRTIFSFSSNLLRLPIYDSDSQTKEMLILLAKQFFVAVQYFLDIEYEVIEKDLTNLWFMVLSYLAIGHCFEDVPDQFSLTVQILGFGSQLVKLYSELRQVGSTIFSLCKAIRFTILRENNSDNRQNCGCFGSCTSYLPCETYAKSVGMLLCSQEFKLAIHNGIKSIPEGQASECLRQLSIDLSESMEWMKICSVGGMKVLESHTSSCKMLCFDLRAELFGRTLSEMYVLVLDSLTVTVGNSSLVGQSIKDLMTVIRPCMSILAAEPNSVYEFLSYITGKTSKKRPDGNKPDLQNFGVSLHWVFFFFFRLYMYCRSLYRQALSLMPPDASRKMSALMWDSFTAYSGRDLMERTDWNNDGYFCWIIQPSASLLDIIQSVCDICLKGSDADCSPLIYVLHAMALQRLVDLNRHMKSLEYILQRMDWAVQVKLSDDTNLALYCKRSKKWRRCLSNLKEEAEGLTEFIMSYLSLLGNEQISVHSIVDATCLASFGQALDESDKWDLGICSLNKKSLPTAIWWIVCQNIDIWCIHASKKKLKIFLSHVIRTCLPPITRNFTDGENNKDREAGFLNKITLHQISSEVLTNSILYEQKFVRRHLASIFCRLLKKSILPLFGDLSIADVALNALPNWQEILGSVGSLAVAIPESESVANKFSEGTPISHVLHEMPADISTELTGMKFTACQSLLNLLCWMPKGYMSSRSFSLYVTYLINLERHVIGNLLECQGASSLYKKYELLRLLVSCRKALKCLLMGFCQKTGTSESLAIPVLSEDLFSVLWFFKSVLVVVGFQETLSKDHAYEIREMIFSLMDYTSYVLLTLCKYHFTSAIHSIVAQKPQKEQPNSNITEEHYDLNESDPCLDSFANNKAWTTILLLAESSKEQMQGLLISLEESLINEKAGNCVNLVHLNKLSSTISCVSGLLWGLSSFLEHSNATNSDKVKLLGWFSERHSKTGLCIDVFASFISSILQMFFIYDHHEPRCSFDGQTVKRQSQNSSLSGTKEFSDKGYSQTDISGGAQNQKLRGMKNFSTSLNIDDTFWSASMQRNSSQLEGANSVTSIDCHCVNNCLMQSLLKGDHPEAAILIRQLLMASSALLRLNLEKHNSSLMPSCFGLCNNLLLKLADVPQPFSFIWLDGVLKYLEELGSYIHTNDDLAKNWHARLIELCLDASGKCITLQGKEATLAHETESSTKKLSASKGSFETSLSRMSLFLDLFKGRLRMLLKVLITKSSEFRMLSVIQAIERALVGVHKGCRTIYKINTGSADGGKVSSTVAAGIDFLDLVLEYTPGGKRSSVVKRHIQSLVAALFNIILHLQSPLVFCSKPTGSIHKGPDPGAVILMCVRVLTRVSGKKNKFEMNSWHVAQSLRVPGALFQDFGQLRLSEAPLSSDVFLFSNNQDNGPVVGMRYFAADQRFSIELFASCCRLLYTTLKQRKSESEECISLLQESSLVLLHCLEMVDTDLTIRKSYFTWGVQEGVKCACYFRRIYEELRQQKDVFGKHCFKFLSDYIWVYSGLGAFKTGIRREIDEALKPGVYALVDACSADDLQYLHSVFGEGPCRNTLAILQHDYKLNFQYEGKV